MTSRNYPVPGACRRSSTHPSFTAASTCCVQVDNSTPSILREGPLNVALKTAHYGGAELDVQSEAGLRQMFRFSCTDHGQLKFHRAKGRTSELPSHGYVNVPVLLFPCLPLACKEGILEEMNQVTWPSLRLFEQLEPIELPTAVGSE